MGRLIDGDAADWRRRARCRGLPTDMFFASETYQGARRVAWEEDVKKICLQCEVQGTCLAHALKSSERHGIWGATTPAERARMVRDGLRSPRRRIG